MLAMFNNADHPHVTLSDWQAFKVAEVARQSVVTEQFTGMTYIAFQSGSCRWHAASRLPVMLYC